MAEQSRTFNFDSFDEQILDALEENERIMPLLRPGQIGSVACRPVLLDRIEPDASDGHVV